MAGAQIYNPQEFMPMVNWMYDIVLWSFSSTLLRWCFGVLEMGREGKGSGVRDG